MSNTTKYEKQRWSWIEVRIKSIDKSWLRKDKTSRRIRKNVVSKVHYNFHLAFGNQKFGAYGRTYWELTEQRGMIVASSDVSIFIQKRYCPMCSELAGGIWLCSGDFQSTSDVSCCLAAEKHVWRSNYWKRKWIFAAMFGNFRQNLELKRTPSLPLLPSFLRCQTFYFNLLDWTVLRARRNSFVVYQVDFKREGMV